MPVEYSFTDILERARKALNDYGLVEDEINISGEKTRCGTLKEPYSLNGFYVVHADFPPSITIINYQDGAGGEKHKVPLYDRGALDAMTEAEREEMREKIRREKEAAQARREEERRAAAEKANALFQTLPPAGEDNAYLRRKGVLPMGDMRQDKDGRLVLPVRNAEGRIVSLQYIDGTKTEANKRFLKGGEKKGCFFPVPAKDRGQDGPLLIGEGVATVVSACMATGYGGLTAFDAGNLEAVAKMAREKYPDREIVLLADNDVHEDGSRNTGVEAATAAAQAVGGKLAVCPAIRGHEADFNDLFTDTEDGPERVRVCIEKAMREGGETRLPAGYFIRAKGDKAGLYKLEEKGDDVQEYRLGPPLRVLGRTKDEHSKNWGFLLEWRDPANVLHRMALPEESLQKQGREWASMLAADGYSVAPGMHGRFVNFLYGIQTKRMITNVSKVGWFNKGDVKATTEDEYCFVLPDVTIGAEDGIVVLQTLDFVRNAYQTGGSFEKWQEMAALCAGNSRLSFFLCAGFAGALLKPAGMEGGGFSIEGDSSCGKSTCLKVAASAWNECEKLRTWRTTSNGLEAVATMFNDGVLVLDEVGEVQAHDLSEAAYMLANGSGKTRAGRSGGARQTASWRLLFLSSGEVGLKDKLEAAGIKPRAGQEVRYVNIPVDTSMVSALHGFDDSASLVNHIRNLCENNYGHASRAFLGWLVKNYTEVQSTLGKAIPCIENKLCPSDAGEQVHRVARRFALVAVAGNLAKAAGIIPDAVNPVWAVRSCFDGWLSLRGGAGASEDSAILSAVQLFIERNGQSCFQDIDHPDAVCINRVGFRRKVGDNRYEYIVLRESFKKMIGDYGVKRALAVLENHGWLKVEAGRIDPKVSLPGLGRPRVYVLTMPDDSEN